MIRVLLTGAAGFMGSHVLRHLLTNTDWHIVCLDSFRHKGLTDRLRVQMEGISGAQERVTVLMHDLRAPISPQLASLIGQVNYVLNVASESHVDRSIEDPRTFIENNVQLILTMLDYIRKYPVEKFIQISTDEVYGPAPEGHNHKEGEPHLPSNPYSASKAAQEDICFSYWRTYDLPIFITNTMNIIGEMQDPEKFIPRVMQQIERGEVVTVHANKDRTKIGSRFYLHARNQADALLFLLKNAPVRLYSDGGKIPRFNIVGEKETTNLELVQMVAKFMNRPDFKYELVDFHSSRPGHDLRYALDGTLMSELGWKAPLSLEDSLRVTVDWTLQHKEWLK